MKARSADVDARDGRGSLDPELPALLPGLLLADTETGHTGRPVRRSPRDWFVDVVAFLVAVGLGAAAFVPLANRDGLTALRVTDLVVGTLCCLSLWWRRRWPTELAVVVALLSLLSASSGPASVILLFTVAVHRRFTVAVVVAALNIAVSVVYYWLSPDPDMSWGVSTVVSTLVVVAITAWGLFVRARRQLVLSLRERAHQAEAEAALRVEQARHLERERIAREMHDVLAHRISLLSVHAGALEYRPDAPPDDVARAASVIRASAHQALQDLREVIGVLRAPSPQDHPDRPQPTLDQLSALIDESRAAGMRVTVSDRRTDVDLPPPAVARCAFRVVQEGLTNVRKHAGGTGVHVALDGGPGDGLRVEVRNRVPVGSTPSSPIPGAGTGLIGLAERVGLAGGRFEHGFTADGDFRVVAWLPWPA